MLSVSNLLQISELETTHKKYWMTIAMDSEREYLCLESCVRGDHIYKKRWTPLVGERLRTRKEDSNCHDRFAVAVFKADKSTVGRIPREFSRVAWYFLRNHL